MPAGRLDKICETTPLSKLLTKEQIEELKEKALDPDWVPVEGDTPSSSSEEDDIDPMNVPADMDFLMSEIKKKGGLRFDNCQEFGLYWDLLEKSDYPDNIKEQAKAILLTVINIANLWIIHYNKHKSK
jgi:hypothetical protein